MEEDQSRSQNLSLRQSLGNLVSGKGTFSPVLSVTDSVVLCVTSHEVRYCLPETSIPRHSGDEPSTSVNSRTLH